MSHERDVRVRMGLGLGVIVLTLLLLPLALNLARGGAAGVGVDPRTQGSELLFAITFSEALEAGPLDGRLVLIVARDSSPEPRLLVSPGPEGQQIFGMDVRGWEPRRPVELTDTVFGFPLVSLGWIPPGDYWVQAVLDRYETYRLDGGVTVELPARMGGGRPWHLRPGNLLSRPVRARIDPRSDDVIRVELSRRIPDVPEPHDSAHVKHLRIRSEKLSRFWGRDVFVGATVFLPHGWGDHPGATYPLVLLAGAPDVADLDASIAGSVPVDPVPAEEDGAGGSEPFPRRWAGAGFPRLIFLVLHPSNPYFHGFPLVSSANLGPNGEALAEEILPEVERRFRAVGEPWARAIFGVGAGAWEAQAAGALHPGAFNGVWASCAAPLDLRSYAGIELHRERNAYHYDRAWGITPRPGRGEGGRQAATLEQENHWELVLGTRGRSGQWWDGWQAVFSPRGEDGYPRPIWDKRTGRIDPEVAGHWSAYGELKRIPPDNSASTLPGATPSFCESGEPGGGHASLKSLGRVAPLIAAHFLRTAPAGADTVSWRY